MHSTVLVQLRTVKRMGSKTVVAVKDYWVIEEQWTME